MILTEERNFKEFARGCKKAGGEVEEKVPHTISCKVGGNKLTLDAMTHDGRVEEARIESDGETLGAIKEPEKIDFHKVGDLKTLAVLTKDGDWVKLIKRI